MVKLVKIWQWGRCKKSGGELFSASMEAGTLPLAGTKGDPSTSSAPSISVFCSEAGRFL
jgi:hypothetical protein